MKIPTLNKKISLTALLFLSSISFAQTKVNAPAEVALPPKAADTRSSDKVDLKKLEEKYWSAKDEDYSVIQNRLFSKSGKFYISGVYGTLINDPFAKASIFGAHLGYYFNEDFGAELSYLGASSTKSDSVAKFNSLSSVGTSPNYNLPESATGASISYTPFYAKMAFMNMSIMYFDMGFTLGAGIANYSQVQQATDNFGFGTSDEFKIKQSSPYVEIGFMQQLFITKNFAFRLDLKNSFYTEKIVVYKANTPKLEESKTKNDTKLTLGITLFTN